LPPQYLEHLEPRELTLFLLLERKESPLLMTRFPDVEKFLSLRTGSQFRSSGNVDDKQENLKMIAKP
jgi:hypothetical protein